MLTLKCKIEIECEDTKKLISFNYAHHIEVKTSISTLTDTATVKLPRSMQRDGKLLLDSLGQGTKKDKIKIYMGYEEYGQIEEVFTGYITDIRTEITAKTSLLILSCENEMYMLRTAVDVQPKDDDKFNIKTFVEEKAKIECKVIPDNLSFGCMIIKQEKMADLLDRIKQKYPYVECYFQNKTLYVVEDGELECPDTKPIIFDPSRNMISDELKYIAGKEEICLIATTIDDDNVKIQVANDGASETKKDKNGNAVLDDDEKPILTAKENYEERHRYCPQYKTKEELQEYANTYAKMLTETRMEGSFTAFGFPFVRKGNVVELHDDLQPERHKKRFVVEGVIYTFNTDEKTGGYRQKITLGRQIK